MGGERGRVMGAIAIVGCIAGVGGTEGQPMLMAAMVIGPFAGWVIKKFDEIMDGHMPSGFEMLINNFSVGILAMLIATVVSFLIASPIIKFTDGKRGNLMEAKGKMSEMKAASKGQEAISDIVVKNTAVDNIPADCDVAVVQRQGDNEDRLRFAACFCFFEMNVSLTMASSIALISKISVGFSAGSCIII